MSSVELALASFLLHLAQHAHVLEEELLTHRFDRALYDRPRS